MAGADREAILLLAPVPQDLRAALAQRYELVEDRPADGPRPGFRIAVTTAMAGAGAAQFDRLPDLKLLSSQGTGLERIDLPGAARRGIAVAYTPDVMTEDVADAAIGLMYAAARRIAEADRFVRAGRWGPERIRPSVSLHRKAVGIAGFGRGPVQATVMPSPAARRAMASPMRPMPAMPTALRCRLTEGRMRSGPQRPARTKRSASAMRRAAAYMRPMAASATSSVITSGV